VTDEIELAERLAQFYEAGRGVIADLVAFEAAGWRPDDIVTWTPFQAPPSLHRHGRPGR
jgi:hypothetical protein